MTRARAWPAASSDAVARRMVSQRRKDTHPELALRAILHRSGLRYRVHVRPVQSLRREADIVFRGPRVAVFVDGCFWHGCQTHPARLKCNSMWWEAKIARNRDRDRETDILLLATGWFVVRTWEHEDPEEAAKRVIAAVRGG